MSETEHDKTGLNFTQFVQAIDNGNFHADMDKAVRDLVAAMQDVRAEAGGKPKGKIAITFDLKLDGGVLEVLTDHKVTTPKRPIAKSVFWSTRDNKLSRANPNQFDLNFSDANRPPRAVN